MKHVRPLNKKARNFEKQLAGKPAEGDPKESVSAMQGASMGCSLIFDPGWEVDSTGGVTGLCQPVEADLYGCADDCWWPAQVPDQLTSFPDWADKCAAAERDWKNLDLLNPDKP